MPDSNPLGLSDKYLVHDLAAMQYLTRESLKLVDKYSPEAIELRQQLRQNRKGLYGLRALNKRLRRWRNI